MFLKMFFYGPTVKSTHYDATRSQRKHLCIARLPYSGSRTEQKQGNTAPRHGGSSSTAYRNINNKLTRNFLKEIARKWTIHLADVLIFTSFARNRSTACYHPPRQEKTYSYELWRDFMSACGSSKLNAML
jgi:hypothetical protein